MFQLIFFVWAFGASLMFLVTLLLGLSLREHWAKGDTIFLHLAACLTMAVVWPYTAFEMMGIHDFDFAIPYERYPRKGEGKKAGMERLKKLIRSEADYRAFCQAVDNYAALCKAEGRERSYIKYWSTFVNNYTDYLDPEISEQPPSGNVDQLQRVLKGEL